jgi:Phage tail tube protein
MSSFQSYLTVAKQTGGWGTANVAAPTRALEAKKFTPKLKKDPVKSMGLKPGRTTMSESQVRQVSKGVFGDYEGELHARGDGLLIEAGFGSVATTGPAVGKYTHTYSRASNAGKVLQFQSLHQFDTANGGLVVDNPNFKVDQLTISAKVNSYVELKCALAGRDEIVPPMPGALPQAAPVYPAGQDLFPWDLVTVWSNGNICVDSFEVSIGNNLKKDRFKMCPGGMDEPIQESMSEDTIKLSGVRFDDLNQYNAFRNNTLNPIVITCLGGTDPTNVLTITATKCLQGGNPLPELDASSLLTEFDLEFMLLAPDAGGSQVTLSMVCADSVP